MLWEAHSDTVGFQTSYVDDAKIRFNISVNDGSPITSIITFCSVAQLINGSGYYQLPFGSNPTDISNNTIIANDVQSVPIVSSCNVDHFMDPPNPNPETGEQCYNVLDEDSDGLVNDGCPPWTLLVIGRYGYDQEMGEQCGNGVDDDGDGVADDGCPPPEDNCGGYACGLYFYNNIIYSAGWEWGDRLSWTPHIYGGVFDYNTYWGMLSDTPTESGLSDEIRDPKFVNAYGPGAETSCANNLDDDSDGRVNDGCVAFNAAEAGAQCVNATDDDSDGLINDGCPAFGPYPTLGSTSVDGMKLWADSDEIGAGYLSAYLGSLDYWGNSVSGSALPNRGAYNGTGLPVPTSPDFQAAGSDVGSTGSVSPAWPTHQAGDVALLIVESAGNQAASLSSAQGFAAVADGAIGDDADATGTRLTLFWKRATSSAEAAPTVADSGDHTLAKIVTFRGVIATGNPWDAVSTSATSGSGDTTFAMPSITTTSYNTLLVNIVSFSNPLLFQGHTCYADWHPLSSNSEASTSAGNDGAFSIATKDLAASGSQSGVTGAFYTDFDSPSSQRNARIVIALKSPAP